MVIGVLALQGDFAEHRTVLDVLNIQNAEIRNQKDLSECDALIIPGGESTVMMKLLKESELDLEIIRRANDGMPVFGTCAGAILLSDSHLNLMDISVERNAYGRQTESFSTTLQLEGNDIAVSFIRAPKIIRTGDAVEVLLQYEDSPVLVRQGNILAATFHTEVTDESAIHELFLSMCCAR